MVFDMRETEETEDNFSKFRTGFNVPVTVGGMREQVRYEITKVDAPLSEEKDAPQVGEGIWLSIDFESKKEEYWHEGRDFLELFIGRLDKGKSNWVRSYKTVEECESVLSRMTVEIDTDYASGRIRDLKKQMFDLETDYGLLVNADNSYVRRFDRELAIMRKAHPEGGLIIEDFVDDMKRIATTFSSVGCSGGSAPFYIGTITNALRHILSFEPLTPLTGDDSEWDSLERMGDFSSLQNNRMTSVFKDKEGDGRSSYLYAVVFQGEDKYDRFFGTVCGVRHSQYIKKFPFTPKTFTVHLHREPYDPSNPRHVRARGEGDSVECGTGLYVYFLKDPKELDAVREYYDTEYVNPKSSKSPGIEQRCTERVPYASLGFFDARKALADAVYDSYRMLLDLSCIELRGVSVQYTHFWFDFKNTLLKLMKTPDTFSDTHPESYASMLRDNVTQLAKLLLTLVSKIRYSYFDDEATREKRLSPMRRVADAEIAEMLRGNYAKEENEFTVVSDSYGLVCFVDTLLLEMKVLYEDLDRCKLPSDGIIRTREGFEKKSDFIGTVRELSNVFSECRGLVSSFVDKSELSRKVTSTATGVFDAVPKPSPLSENPSGTSKASGTDGESPHRVGTDAVGLAGTASDSDAGESSEAEGIIESPGPDSYDEPPEDGWIRFKKK